MCCMVPVARRPERACPPGSFCNRDEAGSQRRRAASRAVLGAGGRGVAGRYSPSSGYASGRECDERVGRLLHRHCVAVARGVR